MKFHTYLFIVQTKIIRNCKYQNLQPVRCGKRVIRGPQIEPGAEIQIRRTVGRTAPARYIGGIAKFAGLFKFKPRDLSETSAVLNFETAAVCGRHDVIAKRYYM